MAMYMSPEQISGKRLDRRSDVFSTGVVLFELLTGQRPFEAHDLTSIAMKIARKRHPRLSMVNPALPRILEKIIDRALEKDPEKRYASAGLMASHLKRIVAKIDEIREGRDFETHR